MTCIKGAYSKCSVLHMQRWREVPHFVTNCVGHSLIFLNTQLQDVTVYSPKYCQTIQRMTRNLYRYGARPALNAFDLCTVLQQLMLAFRRLFQLHACFFQQYNAKMHSANITTVWLQSKRMRLPDRSACSPNLSPIVCA